MKNTKAHQQLANLQFFKMSTDITAATKLNLNVRYTRANQQNWGEENRVELLQENERYVNPWSQNASKYEILNTLNMAIFIYFGAPILKIKY